jgi:hypothetical protein
MRTWTILATLTAAALAGCARTDRDTADAPPLVAEPQPEQSRSLAAGAEPTSSPQVAPSAPGSAGPASVAPATGGFASAAPAATASVSPVTGHSAPLPQRTCASARVATAPDGRKIDCYPYRCRNGACLRGCLSDDDCAPSARPGESLIEKGWPLECAVAARQCVPLPPDHVVGP